MKILIVLLFLCFNLLAYSETKTADFIADPTLEAFYKLDCEHQKLLVDYPKFMALPLDAKKDMSKNASLDCMTILKKKKPGYIEIIEKTNGGKIAGYTARDDYFYLEPNITPEQQALNNATGALNASLFLPVIFSLFGR